MMYGYNLIAFVLGLSALVIALAVLVDVYTQPVVNTVRRAAHNHHIPTWSERYQKRHIRPPQNTHKHRRH